MRINLQKIEFLLCWLMVFANLLCIMGQVEDTSKELKHFQYVSILTIEYFYFRISAISRGVAYAFDFARASIIFKTSVNKDSDCSTDTDNGVGKIFGCIPEWLILHHFGVLVLHISMAFFIFAGEYDDAYRRSDDDAMNQGDIFLSPLVRITIVLLGMQASHNSWTKRHSIILYWGNAFGIGVTSCIALLLPQFEIPHYFCADQFAILESDLKDSDNLSVLGQASTTSRHNNNKDVIESIVTAVYAGGVIVTIAGMSKLVVSNVAWDGIYQPGKECPRRCQSTA